MTAAESATPGSAPHRVLRRALIVIAALELLGALSDLATIFADFNHDTALLRFAQALINVKLALAPLVTGAALYFAARGQLRYAIFALAALWLLTWLLDDVWSIVIHGFKFTPDFAGVAVFIQHIGFPALAVAASVLARDDRRLPLAGLLVCLPTLVNLSGVALFALVVASHGF